MRAFGIYLTFAWLIRLKMNIKLRMTKALFLAVTRDRIAYCAIGKRER
ncbi:DUF5592 family protein [Virgibacillus halodenitrificans]|nr:DUF5592 family protein [Virgibacillus halodenitrificans]WHX25114.1 DUF5592 family protein [Virgibacillus halodenitrificans]